LWENNTTEIKTYVLNCHGISINTSTPEVFFYVNE